MKIRWKYALLPTVVLLLMGCGQRSMVKDTLTALGEHGRKWESVLRHYQDEPQKLEAACFLLQNMSKAYGTDASLQEACVPFYLQYDSLMRVYGYDSLLKLFDYERKVDWDRQVDSLWSAFYDNHSEVQKRQLLPDLQILTTQQLIAEIDLAFEAWRSNVYTHKGCTWEEFCEYILPYRRRNGLLIDSARMVFYERHHKAFFRQVGKDMIAEADSLLYQYRHISHSGFAGMQIPILSAAALEQLRHGLCEHKCWFNSLLFSALGMAVAVDFVPAWGNRNNSHTWNVLISNGRSYAFESFWDEDRWKYKEIYNNRSCDKTWGKYRLPKVYRHTYKQYVEGPMADGAVSIEDIPSLFRNVNKKDVSHEYFDTANVTIALPDIPLEVKYAYLCVLNYNQWQPVQWGKVEHDKACFRGMGKGIVYLPMYCSFGVMQPVGNPFILQEDGSMRSLVPDSEKEEVLTYHYNGALAYAKNRLHYDNVAGIRLVGGRVPDALNDTLCILPEEIELASQRVALRNVAGGVRYVRLCLPHDSVALGMLNFYAYDDGEVKRIEHVRFMDSYPVSERGEKVENILNETTSDGYKHGVRSGRMDIDLGGVYQLESIRFAPYLKVGYEDRFEYELCYWQDGWRRLGKQQGGKPLLFTDVPKNALLLVRPSNNTQRVGSRPFIYEHGEVQNY